MYAGMRDGLGSSGLMFAIMLQRLPVKLRLIGFSCVANLRLASSDLRIIQRSREMEISYKNRLIEISRELYDILAWFMYHIYTMVHP